ncbi:cytochrome-c peroxidase [Pseudodonghicola flavimaris]|uniref:Cytochrome c peroxidase n=1 Tax=Pseudodonghicola flavimaris TaxID=3050036 RepID=A0ABT7F7Q8_9RHOB|nr:cytochrome c peroxidase [Pseudodonghicola flavimaris]MDK3020649.1 cytochrome c peroxidase [Pseudodonghicola flavimaris]
MAFAEKAVAALCAGVLVLGGGGAVRAATPQSEPPLYDSLEELGEALFFDPNLSMNRTQSCSTCHTPDAGFVDPRETDAGRAVSLGDDGQSLGTRNAPTASYAALTPPFHLGTDGKWVGGQFLDGRAATLEDQAGGPPVNPVEMGMPDHAAVVDRLRENSDYVAALQALVAPDIFDDADQAYAGMTKALAAYERTPEFAPFDSKYDRYLRGDYQLTPEEDLGRLLFFSQQFTNCNICHQLKTSPIDPEETFSNYQYHNIGVPANPAVAAVPDQGLLDNPQVTDPAEAGKFKVPSLRNVAVTAPYMHNGVFRDLRTVVLFYNKYNSKSAARQINRKRCLSGTLSAPARTAR